LNDKVGANEMKFVSNAPLEDITGNVESKLIESEFKFDPANIESANGKISFRVDGMETGISRRDKHLQSSDWLDANKHPI
jgi:polyisoprenoid-binding protein YceI